MNPAPKERVATLVEELHAADRRWRLIDEMMPLRPVRSRTRYRSQEFPWWNDADWLHFPEYYLP